MESHWIDNLKKAKDRIQIARAVLDETTFYCEMDEGVEEQLLRLSEHCTKMVTNLNMIILLEKEKLDV
jgi:hypothetical protein